MTSCPTKAAQATQCEVICAAQSRAGSLRELVRLSGLSVLTLAAARVSGLALTAEQLVSVTAVCCQPNSPAELLEERCNAASASNKRPNEEQRDDCD